MGIRKSSLEKIVVGGWSGAVPEFDGRKEKDVGDIGKTDSGLSIFGTVRSG